MVLADADGGAKLPIVPRPRLAANSRNSGQRLIAGTPKKIADLFFANFAAALATETGMIARDLPIPAT